MTVSPFAGKPAEASMLVNLAKLVTAVSEKRNEILQLQTIQIPNWKCWAAEFIGTLLLTFVATLPVVIGASSAEITHADKVVSPGLLVMVMIYVLGNLSGAHFNPAVTLAFAVRRSFPWREVLPYWIAQLGGALLASSLVLTVFGDAMHLGATTPAGGATLPALVTEIITTTMLVMVILGTSTKHKVAGHNAAIAVGATISFCGMIGSPVSGASMNPARSFGPALLGGTMSSYWIYVVGPICGAMIATGLFTLLQGWPSDETTAGRKVNLNESNTGNGQ